MGKLITALRLAYSKGYRVTDSGDILTPNGNHLCGLIGSDGYLLFKIRLNRVTTNVRVHRLQAFQKYGESLFQTGIEVRHLDGNKRNNRPENIAIGTHSQNTMDKPKSERIRQAILASSNVRKFSDSKLEKIKAYHEKHRSYNLTMKRFGISSKGTLHYMLNANYHTNL